jgi:hypothetical protein
MDLYELKQRHALHRKKWRQSEKRKSFAIKIFFWVVMLILHLVYLSQILPFVAAMRALI